MSEHPHSDWPDPAAWEERRRLLRRPGDGLEHGFARPHDVEPLASRIERGQRVGSCRALTREMIGAWQDAGWPVAAWEGPWVKGVRVDFLVASWTGVFLIWSVDQRWTWDQAALVQPARVQVQAELAGWPGQVEAIFHSPREGTGWHRQMIVHPYTDEPLEIVTAGGRIDAVLADWRPVGQVGLDPEWIEWLATAAQPRWWRSNEGRLRSPEIPREEQL